MYVFAICRRECDHSIRHFRALVGSNSNLTKTRGPLLNSIWRVVFVRFVQSWRLTADRRPGFTAPSTPAPEAPRGPFSKSRRAEVRKSCKVTAALISHTREHRCDLLTARFRREFVTGDVRLRGLNIGMAKPNSRLLQPVLLGHD